MKQSLTQLILWVFTFLAAIAGVYAAISNLIPPFAAFLSVVLVISICSSVYFLAVSPKEGQDKGGTNESTERAQKGSKTKGILSLISSVILSVTLLLMVLRADSTKNTPCTFKGVPIGVVVSKFAPSDDNFSRMVHSNLVEKNLDDSIYTVERVDKFYFDRVTKSHFKVDIDSLCLNSGLIISGIWNSDDRAFDTKIRFHNFATDLIKGRSFKNSTLPIRNPNIEEFSIDNQAEILSDFIYALLSYYENDFAKAKEGFMNVLAMNKNERNNRFISYCHTFLGNIYVNDQPQKAYEQYKRAYDNYNLNHSAHSNLIFSLFSSKNYREAKKYLETFDVKPKSQMDSLLTIVLRKENERLKAEERARQKGIKKIELGPSGVLVFDMANGEEVRVTYTKLDEYKFAGRFFFLFTSNENLVGILDNEGILVSLPKYQGTIEAQNWIISQSEAGTLSY